MLGASALTEDGQYDQTHPRSDSHGPTLFMLPSEYVARQVHITFQEDRVGILGTEVFGENNYMWASDYPHGGSAWPHCREQIETQFEGISNDIRVKLTLQNGAALYGVG